MRRARALGLFCLFCMAPALSAAGCAEQADGILGDPNPSLDSGAAGADSSSAETGGSSAGGGMAGTTGTAAASGTAGTAGDSCVGSGDCDDANPCTNDACSSGACKHVNNNADCSDDGDDCTADVCDSGSCTHPANGTCDCVPGDACDDMDPCTDDVCDSGSCTHNDNASCECLLDEDCDDTNDCTDDDCTAEKTCESTANSALCETDDDPCTFDRCSAKTCGHPANDSCIAGSAFTVDSFNNSVDWGNSVTTPDGRAVSWTGFDLTNLQGNADLFLAEAASGTLELAVASMAGLATLAIEIKSAQTATESMIQVGAYDGATWTDLPLATYGSVLQNAYSTLSVPLLDFVIPLGSITKVRLVFTVTDGVEKQWTINDIAAID